MPGKDNSRLYSAEVVSVSSDRLIIYTLFQQWLILLIRFTLLPPPCTFSPSPPCTPSTPKHVKYKTTKSSFRIKKSYIFKLVLTSLSPLNRHQKLYHPTLSCLCKYPKELLLYSANSSSLLEVWTSRCATRT